jgi:hypothetical protein
MSKLVLQLLISDQNGKLYRNTGIRIFDRRSLNAATSAVRAKSFGLISKGKFLVQLPRPSDALFLDEMGLSLSREEQEHLRLWGLSGETGLLPLFVKVGEYPVIVGPVQQARVNGPFYGINGDISHLFNETH